MIEEVNLLSIALSYGLNVAENEVLHLEKLLILLFERASRCMHGMSGTILCRFTDYN